MKLFKREDHPYHDEANIYFVDFRLYRHSLKSFQGIVTWKPSSKHFKKVGADPDIILVSPIDFPNRTDLTLIEGYK